MSWVKIDDNFPDHPKMVSAGPLAMILHVKAMCYAARYSTDGFVPTEAALTMVDWSLYGVLISEHDPDDPRGLPVYPCNVDLVAELVRVNAWEEAPGGYRIHDFGVYNPPRGAADLASQRSEAGRRGAAARWDGKRRVANGKPMAKTSDKMATNGKPMAKAMANTDGKPDFANGKPMPRARASDPDPDPVPVPHADPPVSPPGGATRTAGEPSAGPGPDPDLIALAQTLAAEGSGLGKSVTERVAQGRLPTPNQRDALRKIRDERAEAARPLPPAPTAPRPKAREPTRAEVERMLADVERDQSTMSPARVDVVGLLGGKA